MFQTTDTLELTPALKKRNLRTALWVLGIIAFSMAMSYFGRHLMVPSLFKVG
jgi:hypothetical protein